MATAECVFEPQMWRPGSCRRCFRVRAQHTCFLEPEPEPERDPESAVVEKKATTSSPKASPQMRVRTADVDVDVDVGSSVGDGDCSSGISVSTNRGAPASYSSSLLSSSSSPDCTSTCTSHTSFSPSPGASHSPNQKATSTPTLPPTATSAAPTEPHPQPPPGPAVSNTKPSISTRDACTSPDATARYDEMGMWTGMGMGTSQYHPLDRPLHPTRVTEGAEEGEWKREGEGEGQGQGQGETERERQRDADADQDAEKKERREDSSCGADAGAGAGAGAGPPVAPDLNSSPVSWCDEKDSNDEQKAAVQGTVMEMMMGAETSAGTATASAPRNFAFLAEIRARVHVPLRAVERPVLDETVVVDFSSELHWRLKKKKRTSEQRTKLLHQEGLSHLDTIAGRVSRFGNVISGETATLERAISIVKHMNDFIKQYQLNKHFLDEKEHRRNDFPRVKYDALVTLVRAAGTLEERITAASSYTNNYLKNKENAAKSADWIVLDAGIIEHAMNGILNSYSDVTMKMRELSSIVAVDATELLSRAGVAGNALVSLLLSKSLRAYSDVMDGTGANTTPGASTASSSTSTSTSTPTSPALSSFSLSSRAVKAFQMFSLVSRLANSAESSQLCTLTESQQAMLRDIDTWRQHLQSTHHHAIAVTHRRGEWDRPEMVRLRSTPDHRMTLTRGDTHTTNHKYTQLLELLRIRDMSSAQCDELRVELSSHTFDDERILQWGRMAIMSRNMSGLRLIMSCMMNTPITPDRVPQLLHEAVLRNGFDALNYLVTDIHLDVNYRSPHGGHSPLHIAAQSCNLALMSYLIRHGANPLIINSFNRTPLSLLAIKLFPSPLLSGSSLVPSSLLSPSYSHYHSHPHFLSSYLDNPSLSDVILSCDTGETYYAHRIVLCSQSPVFAAMLDGNSPWKQDQQHVVLCEMSAAGLGLLLRYLYTGECLLSEADASICVEMLRLSCRFLLDGLRLHVERVVSARVDVSNVIVLLHLADACGCALLAEQCRHVLTSQYAALHDPQHQALLHVLDQQAQAHHHSLGPAEAPTPTQATTTTGVNVNKEANTPTHTQTSSSISPSESEFASESTTPTPEIPIATQHLSAVVPVPMPMPMPVPVPIDDAASL